MNNKFWGNAVDPDEAMKVLLSFVILDLRDATNPASAVEAAMKATTAPIVREFLETRRAHNRASLLLVSSVAGLRDYLGASSGLQRKDGVCPGRTAVEKC